MSLVLTSSAFKPDERIPTKYTCDGDDVSPPLSWQGTPPEAQSLVLIFDDPDAPNGMFSHWVLYNLPADMTSLPEAYPTSDEPSSGGTQGRNDFGSMGYGGPCPPQGSEHRYYFRLYALNRQLDIPAGATRAQILDRIQPHIIDRTELSGTYSRS